MPGAQPYRHHFQLIHPLISTHGGITSMPTYNKLNHWNNLLSHMLEGVQQAIVDASNRRGRYTATQGKLEKTNLSGSHYTFRLADDWEPAANTRVLILLNPNDTKQAVAGTILSTINNSITLVT